MSQSFESEQGGTEQNNSNFKQTIDMLRNYLSKKRYAHVWDELMKFYPRSYPLLSNDQSLSCAKLGYCAYQRQLCAVFKHNNRNNHNSLHHQLNSSPHNQFFSNIDVKFLTLFRTLLSYHEILSVQMNFEDPDYFNMVFRTRRTNFSELFVTNARKIFQANPKRLRTQCTKPDNQLRQFFKCLLKALSLSVIYTIQYKNLQQILSALQLSHKILEQFPDKYFAKQKVEFDIIKFSVLQTYELSPEALRLEYAFPIELVSRIYKQFWSNKMTKLKTYYAKFEEYILLSLKYLPIEKSELKVIESEYRLLRNTVNIKFKRPSTIGELIDQKLGKQLKGQEQIIFLIGKYFPNLSDYLNKEDEILSSQKQPQALNTMFSKKKLFKMQSSNYKHSKSVPSKFITRNIKIIAQTKNKCLVNQNYEFQETMKICRQLKFNTIQILNDSQVQNSKQPHLFELQRKQHIQGLNNRFQEQSYPDQSDSGILQTLQEYPQENKQESLLQQINFLDEVIDNKVNSTFQKTTTYRPIAQVKSQLKALNKLVLNLQEVNQENIHKLKQKSKNKIYNEVYRQGEFTPMIKGNWIKSKPTPLLKLRNRKQQDFLKIEHPLRQPQGNKCRNGITLSDHFDKLSKRINLTSCPQEDDPSKLGS